MNIGLGRNARRSHRERIFQIVFFTFLIGTVMGQDSTVLGQAQVGIYWDTGYTEDTLELSPLPGMATGHIVLTDPISTAGVLGWEFCVNVEGSLLFLNWDIAGQAINLEAPPCFVVGLADPLPPIGNAIRLASFDCMVSQSPPVTLSVQPTPVPSIPGQMAYIPADQPGDLIPLTTLTGAPAVAWINLNNPDPELDVQSLDFGTLPTGLTAIRTFNVTNVGGGVLGLDLQLSAGCEGFHLVGVSGPTSVLPGESTAVVVQFAPVDVQTYTCTVELGPLQPTVSLQGVGREAILSYTVSPSLQFGQVALGQSQTLSALLRNTGEVPLPVVPELAGCGSEFSIVAGQESYTVPPGGVKYVNVRFAPVTEDTFACALSFAPGLDQVALTGTGADLLISYEVPAAVGFGSTYVGGAVNKYITISNTGEGAISLSPALAGCAEDFAIISGGFSVTLFPGNSHDVGVRFQPGSIGSFSCDLLLGTGLEVVNLSGSGREPITSFTSPTEADFGVVQIGAAVNRWVRVYNNGEAPFAVDPVMVGCSDQVTITNAVHPIVLARGESTAVGLRFAPTIPDSFTCQLDLGDVVPSVLLTGTGIPAIPSWIVRPDHLNYLTTAEGDSRDQSVMIFNTGLTILDMDVQMADETLGFSVVEGAGPLQMMPGMFHMIVVRFAPLVAGEFATEVLLGTEVPPVSVTGIAGEVIESCGVSTTSLDFGTNILTTIRTRTFTVTNTGNQVMELAPSSSSTLYSIGGQTNILQPGESVRYTISFRPEQVGVWPATIYLGGTGLCTEVQCTGVGAYQTVPGDDLLGVFFDPGFTEFSTTIGAGHFNRAYVVLYNPSDPSGVAKWECSLNFIGNIVRSPMEYSGAGVNIATEPDYNIVVGGSPLPPATATMLATFRYAVMTPHSVVLVQAGPTATPAIAGQMSWTPGGGADPIAMAPFTGTPIVGEINTTSSVAVAAPTPSLVAQGGQVNLSWPAPTAPQEGCHVYRRIEGETAARLTTAPLASTSGTLQFVDRPLGFAPGTTLYYSYTIVSEGVEMGRSPEVAFAMPRVPVPLTRLLPNVPNPFNPQTEIRFELGRSAQVRVAIYDVTGRLVRMLANTHLEAGPYTRIWQGRDDAGRAVSSGAYYVRLFVEGKADHRKIMLLK